MKQSEKWINRCHGAKWKRTAISYKVRTLKLRLFRLFQSVLITRRCFPIGKIASFAQNLQRIYMIFCCRFPRGSVD